MITTKKAFKNYYLSNIRLLTLCLFLASMFGCAGKAPFIYEQPDIDNKIKGSSVIALWPIKDCRNNSEDQDACFEKDPIESLREIVRNELLSTGQFSEVIFIDRTGALESEDYLDKADFLMKTNLMVMKWEVPEYEEMVQVHSAGAFLAGFAGGLIGGAIYMAVLSQSTVDVYGDAVADISVTRLADGDVLIDKEYTSHFVKVFSKLECDQPETKSEMMGNAIAEIMKEFKTDLVQVLSMESAGIGEGRIQ